MFDFSDVSEFAVRLSLPVPEEEWRDAWKPRLAAEMRAAAPVLTGELKSSIHVVDEGVEVAAPYARYVENGTSDTAPQPFITPSIDRLTRPATEDAIRRVIRVLT